MPRNIFVIILIVAAILSLTKSRECLFCECQYKCITSSCSTVSRGFLRRLYALRTMAARRPRLEHLRYHPWVPNGSHGDVLRGSYSGDGHKRTANRVSLGEGGQFDTSFDGCLSPGISAPVQLWVHLPHSPAARGSVVPLPHYRLVWALPVECHHRSVKVKFATGTARCRWKFTDFHFWTHWGEWRSC